MLAYCVRNQSTGYWRYAELVPAAIDDAWLIGAGRGVSSTVCRSAAHSTSARVQAEVIKFSVCSMRGSELLTVDDTWLPSGGCHDLNNGHGFRLL